VTTTRHRNAPAGLPEAEILRRGLETFAELGYDATSVRELAKRLSVSHNFINDRYGSKARFWRAVVDSAMSARRDDLTALTEDGTLSDEQRLRVIVLDLYRVASRVPQVERMIADESGRDTDRLDYLHSQIIGPFYAGLRPVLERLMEAGRMRTAPPDLIFFAITGPALALSHQPLAGRLGAPADPDQLQRAETLALLVLDGLLPGAKA
jgi:TetR/AcrR family transcriptional regulator